MHFTPREMATLGYLYLNGGRLRDVQIVPQDWIEFSLSPSTNFRPNEWGVWKNYNYAYLWWLGEMNNYHLFYLRNTTGVSLWMEVSAVLCYIM